MKNQFIDIKYKLITILLFTFLLRSQTSGAGNNYFQPLINNLKKNALIEKDFNIKAKMYNEIADKFGNSSFIDSVKYYANKAIEAAREAENKYEEAVALKNIAIISSLNTDLRGYYSIRQDYYENINKAIALFTELHDKKNLADCYRFLSKYYLTYHNHEYFTIYNTNALKLYTELNDSSGIAACNLDLGIIYDIQKKYLVAEHLFKFGEIVFSKEKDTLSLFSVYFNLGRLYKHQLKYKEQLKVLKYACLLSEEYGSNKIIAYAYSYYGEALNNQGKSEKAITFLTKAFNYAQPLYADNLLTQICKNLAAAYFKVKNYNSAFAFQDSSFAHFRFNSLRANEEIIQSEKYERELEEKHAVEQSKTLNIIYLSIILVILLVLLALVYLHRLHRSRILKEKMDIINKHNVELKSVNHKLEDLVNERTSDLYNKNIELKQEIETRKSVELELIKAKELAEEGNNIKSNLLANISHEFRTPLNGILGFTEILGEELNGSPLHEFVLKIGRSSKRLLNTLNSVLTIVELTSESYYSENVTLDINALCSYIIKGYTETASIKSIILHLQRLEDDPFVYVDQNIISRVFQFILDNAIKYTEKGVVTVSIFTAHTDGKDEMAISVRDTGIGIKNQDRKLLFKEFKQISEGVSREFEGLGLGLALSDKLIRLIGGRITFESEHKNGSEFIIWFPLVRSNETRKKDDFLNSNNTKSSRVLLNILVVEDNDLNAEVLSRFVSILGNVDIAQDAESALKLVSLKKYDLLLIDINLGSGDNGILLLDSITKKESYKDVPAIAITGYASSKTKEKLLNCGFKGYLAKPVEKKELVKLIEELVN